MSVGPIRKFRVHAAKSGGLSVCAQLRGRELAPRLIRERSFTGRRSIVMERPADLANRMKARRIVTERLRMFYALMKSRFVNGADKLFHRAEKRARSQSENTKPDQ